MPYSPFLQAAVCVRPALTLKPKRTVLHCQRAPGKPQQAVPVGVGYPALFPALIFLSTLGLSPVCPRVGGGWHSRYAVLSC